jgi:hypothetical protein
VGKRAGERRIRDSGCYNRTLILEVVCSKLYVAVRLQATAAADRNAKSNVQAVLQVPLGQPYLLLAALVHHPCCLCHAAWGIMDGELLCRLVPSSSPHSIPFF